MYKPEEMPFKTKSIKYNELVRSMSRFIGLRCAPDLLVSGVFPNGKEVTESMGALEAIERHVCPGRVHVKDSDVAFLSVGDGKMPRTAALIAFMTSWDCYSIDPELDHVNGKTNFNGVEIDRLSVIGNKVEDCNLDVTRYGHVVIAGVHSHAKIQEIIDGIRFRVADFVIMPCCVNQPPIGDDVITYRDRAIWSPHNKIVVSRGVKRNEF